MIWLVETTVFSEDLVARLASAIRASGAEMRAWEDAWWDDGIPSFEGPVIFYGSLGNAARLASEDHGIISYCNVDEFKCSSWYPRAEQWILNRYHEFLTAQGLVGAATALSEDWQSDKLFVRPDSPLKPFSGRVLDAAGITLPALDHGFYYEDENLPVAAAPVHEVGGEWRFVVKGYRPIAGSAYLADGRSASEDEIPQAVWDLAEEIALDLTPPDPVYVMDLCMGDGEVKLLELNPFSGADLYHCDLVKVVASVADAVEWTEAE